jgi:xylan 1,4-beta-xylosidase
MFLLRSLIALWLLGAAHAQTYNNPVIPGDHPDPSIIRVGNDYWATSTTSQWAPIFPLLHSTNLVEWQAKGAVFAVPPAWSAGNYWAPEISEYRGAYFVYYAARKKDGPMCVAVATSANPEGPYTDHGPLVCEDVGSMRRLPMRTEIAI